MEKIFKEGTDKKKIAVGWQKHVEYPNAHEI